MTYFLFSGSEEYPAGGADDFVGVFPSIEAAKAHFSSYPQEWAHIARFDGERLAIVCAFGPSWDYARQGVMAWHDCKD